MFLLPPHIAGNTQCELLIFLAALTVGLSKGGLPMVGMLAVPLLSQCLGPVEAAGLLLPIYIVSDMYGLWIYRHEYDARNILILVPAAALGVGLGWLTAAVTNEHLVMLMVGVIGLVFCFDALLKSRRVYAPKPADVPRGLFWGALSGFTSFVAHAGAPPYQLYVLPQRLPKMVYAGTTTIVFALINLLKLPPYVMLGQVNATSLRACLVLAPVALCGAWAGYHLTRIVPEKLFFRLIIIALFLLSLKLVYDARVLWM